jgi:hypothetical protein
MLESKKTFLVNTLQCGIIPLFYAAKKQRWRAFSAAPATGPFIRLEPA